MCGLHAELKQRGEKRVVGQTLVSGHGDAADDQAYSLLMSKDGEVFGLYHHSAQDHLVALIDLSANRYIPSSGAGNTEKAEARRLLKILGTDLDMGLDLCDGWPDCIIPDSFWGHE